MEEWGRENQETLPLGGDGAREETPLRPDCLQGCLPDTSEGDANRD